MLRFSRKSFLISFIAALILFSGIMAIVCYHAFSGHVFVRTDESTPPQSPISVSEPQIYYCLDAKSGSFTYAALAFRDAASGKMYLMHVEGDWLVTYRDALYYVKSLYANDGDEGLCLLYMSLTGAKTDPNDVIDARSLLPDSKKNSYFRFSDFAERLAATIGEEITELSPSFSQSEDHRVIDMSGTRDVFDALPK